MMVTRTRVAGWVEVVLLVLGAIGLLIFGYCLFGFSVGLPQVDPRRHGIGTQGAGLDRFWLVALLITTATILIVGGLPTGRAWSSRGSPRAAIAQGIGGFVIACWTLAVAEFNAGSYFTGSDDACTYPNCWPVDAQKWAFVVPGVLIGVVMIVMALLVTRIPWYVRAFTPVVVWVVAVHVHYWIWTAYLLPIFEGPPR
ncbi:MAG TPA: hypothetical protein VGL05_14350 [Kribbella sp.]